MAWVYIKGDVLTNSVQIDHRDCNCYNNSFDNLREATHSENQFNRRPNKGRTLPKGVGVDNRMKGGRKYRAVITVNRKVILLGSFGNPEEAHLAYRMASDEYHGEFGRAM